MAKLLKTRGVLSDLEGHNNNAILSDNDTFLLGNDENLSLLREHLAGK